MIDSARARFYHEVCEARLKRIIRVDLKSELFSVVVVYFRALP